MKSYNMVHAVTNAGWPHSLLRSVEMPSILLMAWLHHKVTTQHLVTVPELTMAACVLANEFWPNPGLQSDRKSHLGRVQACIAACCP